MPNIETRIDDRRGCGWRKGGGIYLVCDGEASACGRLPLALDVCPTCHGGIKPTRGFTWINPRELFGVSENCPASRLVCANCPLGYGMPEKAGLLWIGEKFYKTPSDFSAESAALGISRRISAVPKDFEVGKTWVLLAHRKAMLEQCDECRGYELDEDGDDACPKCDGRGKIFIPAVFSAFRPTRIEYVVKGDETEEELERLEKRGLTLVKVVRNDAPMFAEEIEKTEAAV